MEIKTYIFKVGIKNGNICISGDDLYMLRSNVYDLVGGIRKPKKLFYPLTKENIDIILMCLPVNKCLHPDNREASGNFKIIYTPAFAIAAHKEIINEEKHGHSIKHLKNINFDNVEQKLKLIKHKDPQPFKNQLIGLQWTNRISKHALLWEMGTGKTRTAIETFVNSKSKNGLTKCLVVCPLSLINKWCDEVEKWSDYTSVGLKGTTEQKLGILNENFFDFYVMNYESIMSLQEELENKIDNTWMIIADETTKIKNPHAKRTKALLQLGQKTEHKMILTGTPIVQHAYDLYSQFLFLNNGRTFGLNYDHFIDKYFWKTGWKYNLKYGKTDEISDLIYKWSTRFKKEDCIDIPEKMYDVRKVDLPEKNQKTYDDMLSYCIAQIENSERITAPIILVQLLRLSQITSGFVTDVTGKTVDFEENPKLEALEDIIEEADNNGNHIVVWSRFKHDIDRIKELCDKMEVTCEKLYSDVKIDDRSRIVNDFENGKIRVLAGTPGTGGLGIELVKANIVVYYSNDYSLSNRLQSEDRTHRTGQTKKVTYIDLVATKTVDLSISKILSNKKNIADMITRDSVLSFAKGIF
jgi:SNF2 family DNA or RNA helicase